MINYQKLKQYIPEIFKNKEKKYSISFQNYIYIKFGYNQNVVNQINAIFGKLKYKHLNILMI